MLTAKGRTRGFSSTAVLRTGQAIAYLGVPLSLVAGQTIESIFGIVVCLYIVAGFGLVAVLRGAVAPRVVIEVGYVFLASYIVLAAVEVANGDLFRAPRPVAADFFGTYFVLLAFPFFVIGLRAVRAERRHFELAMVATIAIAAVWALLQYLVMGINRTGGFNNLNPITNAMIVLLWGLFLLSSALAERRVEPLRLIGALLALVPIALSGSKIVWGCALVGYVLVFLWWAVAWRRWITLAATAAAGAVVLLAAFQLDFVQSRVVDMTTDLGGFLASGSTSGDTFGIRLAAWIGGMNAFVERPFFGFGLADAKIAALTYRPEAVADFGYLWHLHSQYVQSLVSLGVFGGLFLLVFLGVFVYVAMRAHDAVSRRVAIAVPIILALYMSVELVFPRAPLYGTIFTILALAMLSATRSEDEAAEASLHMRLREAA